MLHRCDIVLYHEPGLQQGLDYACLLDVPFVFASRAMVLSSTTRPAPLGSNLKSRCKISQLLSSCGTNWKGFTQAQLPVISQEYHDDNSGKSPRYYQLQAINKTVEAVSAGQKRVLLVMATDTGKTYTAFQIIWRLWKAKSK